MQVYLPNQSFIKIIYSEPYAGLPSQSIKYALKVYTQGRMQVQHWPVPNKPPRFCGRKTNWSRSSMLQVTVYLPNPSNIH